MRLRKDSEIVRASRVVDSGALHNAKLYLSQVLHLPHQAVQWLRGASAENMRLAGVAIGLPNTHGECLLARSFR